MRQFVAMPLDSGYTVEQQVTGTASVGGFQIAAVPMKAEVYRERGTADPALERRRLHEMGVPWFS